MTECKRVSLSGSIRVPLPPHEAFTLFTPDGERAWADGWNPRFPAVVDDDTEPGTVFETEHAGRHTTWMVVHRDPGRAIRYARVTAGDRAGLVGVTCEPASDGATIATVCYRLTALSPEADAGLEDFAAHYPRFLAQWQQSIEGVVLARSESAWRVGNSQ